MILVNSVGDLDPNSFCPHLKKRVSHPPGFVFLPQLGSQNIREKDHGKLIQHSDIALSIIQR